MGLQRQHLESLRMDVIGWIKANNSPDPRVTEQTTPNIAPRLVYLKNSSWFRKVVCVINPKRWTLATGDDDMGGLRWCLSGKSGMYLQDWHFMIFSLSAINIQIGQMLIWATKYHICRSRHWPNHGKQLLSSILLARLSRTESTCLDGTLFFPTHGQSYLQVRQIWSR